MNKRIRKVIGIFLCIAWMLTVFLLSNQDATDSTNTSNFIVRIVVAILKISDEAQVQTVTFIVRKLAHFSLYALGGVLSLSLFLNFDFPVRRSLLFSQLFGTFYAMTDEFHQIFVPGRSGELRDVFIDSLGAFTGIMLAYAFIKLVNKRRK